MSNLLCSVVNFYLILLFARAVLSFVPAFRPGWTPPEALRPVLAIVYGLTDPPVELLRKFIPPLRSGAVALDLAFLIWFIIVAYPIRSVLCF